LVPDSLVSPANPSPVSLVISQANRVTNLASRAINPGTNPVSPATDRGNPAINPVRPATAKECQIRPFPTGPSDENQAQFSLSMGCLQGDGQSRSAGFQPAVSQGFQPAGVPIDSAQ